MAEVDISFYKLYTIERPGSRHHREEMLYSFGHDNEYEYVGGWTEDTNWGVYVKNFHSLSTSIKEQIYKDINNSDFPNNFIIKNKD
jgi:hypothetical protein